MALDKFLSIREYSKMYNVSKETVRLKIKNNEPLNDDYQYKKVDTTWIIYK